MCPSDVHVYYSCLHRETNINALTNGAAATKAVAQEILKFLKKLQITEKIVTKVTVKNSQKYDLLFIKPLNHPKYSSLYIQKYFFVC